MAAKNAAWWVTIVALFGVLLTPLIVTNSLFFPFITGKAFYFRILVEVATGGYLVLAAADIKYRPKWSWVLALFATFVVWVFLADLFAMNPEKAFWSNFERMEGWVTIIHLFLLFIVGSAVLGADGLWDRWWKSSLGVSLLVGIYGLFQLAGLAAIHQGSTRLDATFGNATYLAIYFLIHIFVAGWLAAKYKGWQRYVLIILVVFEGMLLLFTETRGAILGLVAGAAVVAFLAALLANAQARKYAIGGGVAILILAGAFMLVKNEPWVQHEPVLSRIASISLAEGQVRFQIWHIAWEGFLERPIAGWGQEGFNYVFNTYYDPSLFAQEPWFDRAHNEFIDWLVAGGLPAFLLYIGLFFATLYTLWRRDAFTNAERIGFTGLLVAYAVNDVFVFDNLMSYVLFAAALAYIHSRGGTPWERLEAVSVTDEQRIGTLVTPVAGVLIIVLIYFVNVPGIRAAGDLIQAISPQQGGVTANIAAFNQALGDGSFAEQEIAEQMVSVAASAVGQQGIPDSDKTAMITAAVEEMRRLVMRLPKDARLRLELALAYSIGGDDSDALKQVQEALALSPNKEAIITEEGMTKWEAGDAAGAAADFDKAYELGPSFADLAVYKVVSYLINKDYASAHALLFSTFGTTTVDSNVLLISYYRLQDWNDLIGIWQLRLNADKSAQNYFGLASGYASAGRTAEAAAMIRAAIQAHPEVTAQGNSFLTQLASPAP